MMQDEQIKKFITSQVAAWLQEDLLKIDQEFPIAREKIVESLAAALSRICYKAHELQQTGNKGSVAYLCISFLRTNLLEDDWQYRLDLYDEKFYLDSIECTETWELEFVWKHLKRRMSELTDTIKHSLYANKVRSCHLNEIKLHMAEKYQQTAILLTKLLLPEVIERLDDAGVSKMPVITIRMGEYLDHSVPLYEIRRDAAEGEEALCNTSD
jgi:hypothetical protein